MNPLSSIRNGMNIGDLRKNHPEALAGDGGLAGIGFGYPTEALPATSDFTPKSEPIHEPTPDAAPTPAPPIISPDTGPKLGSRMIEGARKAAGVTFRAPGYLSNIIDRKLGDVYAKVRYSSNVDSLVGVIANRSTEHGIATPAVFAVGQLVMKTLASATHQLGHMPDLVANIDMPHINMPNIDLPHFGNEDTNKVEVPTEAQLVATASQSLHELPAGASELHQPAAAVAEHSFKADNGEGAWGHSEDILEQKAEAAGVDVNKLHNADTIKVMDGILDDKDNKGKFYGSNHALLNEGTRYDDEQAMRIADDIIDKYDGKDAPASKTPAPAQHAPLIDIDTLSDKVADAVHDSKTKPAEPTPSEIPVPTPSENDGPNAFKQGWDHTTDWFRDLENTGEAFANEYGPSTLKAIGSLVLAGTLYSAYRVVTHERHVNKKDLKGIRANGSEVTKVKRLSNHRNTQAEADYASTSAAAFREIVEKYGRQPDDDEEAEDDGSEQVEPGAYTGIEYEELVKAAKQKVKKSAN